MMNEKKRNKFKDRKLETLDKKRTAGVRAFVIFGLVSLLALGAIGCIMAMMSGIGH